MQAYVPFCVYIYYLFLLGWDNKVSTQYKGQLATFIIISVGVEAYAHCRCTRRLPNPVFPELNRFFPVLAIHYHACAPGRVTP